jgi:N6-adenosine-specific RNA methylase IME4
VLFATRRSLPLLRQDLSNFISAPARRHSAKPDAFFGLVEQASPGPRLEMFARGQRPGWTTWGAEAGGEPLIHNSGSDIKPEVAP